MPFLYDLNVFNTYDYTSRKVHLLETFNYLVGIYVNKYILKQDQNRDYVIVEGVDRHNRACIVIWRDASNLDFEQDAKFIEAFIADKENEILYVNNQCVVPNSMMIEDVFKSRMN